MAARAGSSRPHTLAECADSWGQRWGGSVAVADPAATLTFAALAETSAVWASALHRVGLRPGERVALWAGNSAAWLVRAFGAWRAGCTLVPVSTFVTARELSEILSRAEPQVLLMDDTVGDKNLLAVLREAHVPPTLRTIVCGRADGAAGVDSEDAFLSRGAASTWNENLARPDDVALVLYTSGTTGAPKGVRLQHKAVLSTLWPTVTRGGLVPGDCVVSSLPLFWVAGLCIRALPTLASGATLVVMPVFRVEELLALLHRWCPTGLHLRPPQVAALLAHPAFDPALLATVQKGGGRTAWYAPHLPKARLITGYGMTETSGYVVALSWRDSARVRATGLGKPLPGVTLKIAGDHGQGLPPGRIGEIRVRGPGLFCGYDGEPAGTNLDPHGYFFTGDLGFLDDKGQLHFVGRQKDLLRSKGVNVSPVEVENVLVAHPGIEAAFVVGLPPGESEQTIVAIVVSRDGESHEADWRAWCRKFLSVYKCPSAYVVVPRDKVPFGPTSKPQRTALAMLAAERLGQRVATGT